MIRTVAVEGYRSLRSLVVPLGQLTVITGANGSGKSSLYRMLRLLAATARGGVVPALAAEGGLESVLWAGPEMVVARLRGAGLPVTGTVRSGPVALRVGFGGDEFGYAIDLGLPPPSLSSMFGRDPEINTEVVWRGPALGRGNVLLDRRGGVVTSVTGRTRTDTGRRLERQDSILAELADVQTAPEVLRLRQQVRSWRFHDAVRTDAGAPARGARPGTFTPVLADDGGDLAAALQTLRELGHDDELAEAVDRAFPGSGVEVVDRGGLFSVLLTQPGLLRPLEATELSDGTLRYLLWTAALLTPRPPELFVLNEPETSLHPELVAPLGELIRAAAGRTQVVVVTHSAALIQDLLLEPGDDEDGAEDGNGDPAVRHVRLRKDAGETVVDGQSLVSRPSWHWPAR